MYFPGVLHFPAQLSGKGRTIDELRALFDYLLLPFEGHDTTLDYKIVEKTHAVRAEMNRLIDDLDLVALLLASECAFALASAGYSAANICFERGQVFRITCGDKPESYYDCKYSSQREQINASYDEKLLGTAVARAHAIMQNDHGEKLFDHCLRHVVCNNCYRLLSSCHA
jgi:hypothetical protein